MGLRARFKTWLARRMLIIEFCHDCGRKQPLIWSADDDLWAAVSDGIGVLCPACFDKRAVRKQILIRWLATYDQAGLYEISLHKRS